MRQLQSIDRASYLLWVVAVLGLVAGLVIVVGQRAEAATQTIEAETVPLRGASINVASDPAASGGKAVAFLSNGQATTSVSGSLSRVEITVRGQQCKGSPYATVFVDGSRVMRQAVSNSAYRDYGVDLQKGDGDHTVEVKYGNDAVYKNCNRSLVLDKIAVVQPDASAPQAPRDYEFALIGNDGTHLQEERAAGIEAKLVSLSWRQYYPSEGVRDNTYVDRKAAEIRNLRASGFRVILSLGYHDTPTWLHRNYDDTHYVNQFGGEWTGDTFSNGAPLDNGDANLVFNDELRGLVASYMGDVFSRFGTDFYAVRLGGGRYGELTYPPASFQGKTNLYWAYDANAQAASPVPGWRPGEPSPDGEAQRFLDWYLGALTGYQNWQVRTLREAGFSGRAMMLYPSWGIRPGQAGQAVAGDLGGTTSAERNGEVQRGFDFARQVGAISDPRVVVTTTWLDANVDLAADERSDQRYWSPVHYLSYLAHKHPLSLEAYGENTGRGDRAEMELSAAQMRRYGLTGMAWYKESEMFSGSYATLEDYASVIASSATAQ